jgi:small GTP-binding protein
MSTQSGIYDTHYAQAITSLEHTIDRLERASHVERETLRTDLAELRQMGQKLVAGRVEIAVFGEISTGKSALINALAGDQVASVDVQGGWTKAISKNEWKTCDYHIPGLEQSQVVLVDTPGINEVGDTERADLAVAAARQADLILFVADSDLHETEYAAALRLASAQKPMLFVLNKIDLYSPAQRERLITVLRDERLKDLIPPDHFVAAAADPREVEYVIQSPDGRTRSEWQDRRDSRS